MKAFDGNKLIELSVYTKQEKIDYARTEFNKLARHGLIDADFETQRKFFAARGLILTRNGGVK